MKITIYGAFFALLSFLYSGKLNAQMAGTYSVPATFSTLAAAISSLNTVGVSGPVNIFIDAGYTETAPVGGYLVTVTGTNLNPVVFKKNGAGINPLITAYVGGTGTPGSASQDGVFKIVGSDYLTFDGIDIYDPNISNPATMEFGYGFFKLSVTNGCQNNTIQNCVITLNKLNNATGTGPASDGSRGIDVVNAYSSTHTSALVITSAAGANSNNKFYSNTIQNCNVGISIAGYATASPFSFSDTGNDIGGNSNTTGNSIINFGGGGTANPAAGIRTTNQVNLNVSYNVINNTSGGGSGHGTTLRGIFVNAASYINGANNSVSGNTIAITCTATISQVSAIECASGSSIVATYSNTINNNVIQNCDYLSATSGVFNAIVNSASTSSLFINGNSISGLNYGGTATAGLIETGSPVFAAVNNNTLTGIVRTGTAGTQRAIRITSPSSLIANGNLIDGINWTTLSSSGGVDGIFSLSAAVNVTITNNIIKNFSIPTIGTCNGIREFGASGNKIIQGNQINTFTTTTGGAGGASFNGIFCSSGSINISGNDVHDLVSSGPAGGNNGNIYGIQITGGTTIDIYKNKIYNLSSNGSGPIVYGVFINGGTTNTIYNNYIGNLYCPYASAVSPLAGLFISGGTTSNVYYNTVYLNASSTSGLFGTNSFYASSTVSLYLRNNIFINNSMSNGAGRTVAYRRSTTTLTNYSTQSNNNIFYAGTPTTNNLLYYDGTNSCQTIAALQATLTPRESLSNTENTNFLSLSGGSPFFLHIDPLQFSFSDNGAVNISGITDDYDTDIRQGNSGYPGTGTAPDIGADEYNANLMNCTFVAPGAITPTSVSACSGQTVAFSATGLTPGTGVVYQWQVATTPGGPYSNATGGTGANTANYTTPTLSPGTYYYAILSTCTITGINAISNEATITINPIPTASVSGNSPVCSGSNLNLICGTDVGTNFNWTGPGAFSSTMQNPVISNSFPYASGVYTVVVSANNCSSTATYTAQVNITPSAITVNPVSSTICSGNSQTLSVAGGAYPASTYSFGTQASQNVGATGSNGYPAPYNAYYGGQKMQMLILASELSSAGFGPGSQLSSIQFPVSSLGSNWGTSITADLAFQVNIGSTLLTSLTSFQSGLTNVVAPMPFTPSVGYSNTHTFSSPFVWDGASNVIIETTFSNNSLGVTGNLVTQYNSPTGFLSTLVYRADNVPASTMAAATSTSYVYSSRPDFKLNSTGFGSYLWSPSTGLSATSGSSVVANPNSSQVYSILVVNGSCSSSTITSLTVNMSPTVSLIAATSSVCINGSTISLTGSPSGGAYSGANVSTGGIFTPGATAGNFNPTYTYTDVVTGCSNSATTNIFVDLCTGLSNNSVKLNGLSVYPNPNAGEFTIELGNGLNKTIEITDLTGRVIRIENSLSDKININIIELANGVYFAKIYSNQSVEIVKLVKQ